MSSPSPDLFLLKVNQFYSPLVNVGFCKNEEKSRWEFYRYNKIGEKSPLDLEEGNRVSEIAKEFFPVEGEEDNLNIRHDGSSSFKEKRKSQRFKSKFKKMFSLKKSTHHKELKRKHPLASLFDMIRHNFEKKNIKVSVELLSWQFADWFQHRREVSGYNAAELQIVRLASSISLLKFLALVSPDQPLRGPQQEALDKNQIRFVKLNSHWHNHALCDIVAAFLNAYPSSNKPAPRLRGASFSEGSRPSEEPPPLGGRKRANTLMTPAPQVEEEKPFTSNSSTSSSDKNNKNSDSDSSFSSSNRGKGNSGSHSLSSGSEKGSSPPQSQSSGWAKAVPREMKGSNQTVQEVPKGQLGSEYGSFSELTKPSSEKNVTPSPGHNSLVEYVSIGDLLAPSSSVDLPPLPELPIGNQRRTVYLGQNGSSSLHKTKQTQYYHFPGEDESPSLQEKMLGEDCEKEEIGYN